MGHEGVEGRLAAEEGVEGAAHPGGAGVGQRRGRAGHAQRREDVGGHGVAVRLAGGGLDQQAKGVGIAVAILKRASGRAVEFCFRQPPDALLQPVGAAGVEVALVAVQLVQPAGLVQQLAHGDGRGGHEPGQVGLDGCIQLHQPLLDQLQHGHGGHRLAERGQ